MLRIPLRFQRQFRSSWKNKECTIGCYYHFPTHQWTLNYQGAPVFSNPGIDPSLDMFGMASNDPRYKRKLRNWIRKELGEEKLRLENKFAYLSYAVTDGLKVAPLWYVWGGTVRYGEPRIYNRKHNTLVGYDGRITREEYVMDPGNRLSSSVFDRYYQAGGVWIAMYDTQVHCPNFLSTRCEFSDCPGHMPYDFDSISAAVMFLHNGHVCEGRFLLRFPEKEELVLYDLTFTDTVAKKTLSREGRILFGPVPKSKRDEYSCPEIRKLINDVLDDIFPITLNEN